MSISHQGLDTIIDKQQHALIGNRTGGAWPAIEFVIACMLLVLAAPVILLAAALIRATSRGPALYCQTRVGRNRRIFTIFKLRTMRHNCESSSGPRWSSGPNDRRITPLGRFLRATHLDELPQLWNVLRGDMSLVGPRPERPEFVEPLIAQLPQYRDRLQVRPGVTGLAQVQLPPDTDLESVRRKLAMDLYYISNRRTSLDLRLILCTAFKMLHIPSSVSLRILRIPSAAAVASLTPTDAEVAVPAASPVSQDPPAESIVIPDMPKRSKATGESSLRLGPKNLGVAASVLGS